VKPLSFTLYILLFAATPMASPQKRSNYPSPPEAADKSITSPEAKPANLKKQLDRPRIEGEARELLELSQSLQFDVQSINRGMLPQDTIAKLKRIEKTSKQLRHELGY
jgi:hypothetical protein